MALIWFTNVILQIVLVFVGLFTNRTSEMSLIRVTFHVCSKSTFPGTIFAAYGTLFPIKLLPSMNQFYMIIITTSREKHFPAVSAYG